MIWDMPRGHGVVCFRHHWPHGPRRHDLAMWITCGIVQHEGARNWLMAAGLLRADHDCGLVYWTWRFWTPSYVRRFAWGALLREAQR